jgi:dienelactone hydrolase
MRSHRILAAFALLLTASLLLADGPGDNLPDKVRPIPPAGITVPEADRNELQAGVDALGKEIETLRGQLKGKAALLDLLPDVQIYHNAVRYALNHNEFFNAKEIPVARTLLKQGMDRAKSLREGKAPWTTATGLVVRGYVSKIDGSVQPYGLVVPASYQPPTPHEFRLDVWFHGRGETLSELNFINARQSSPGEFTPVNTFVLHPYGRYCNANKFAGEIDLLEALAHVQAHYPIDEDRIAVRGFSMGGAACWQFAVHYASRWAAAAPGAGFSETPDFLKVFQNEEVKPTWYEKKLWHLYDCTDWAMNLYHCPTVAYSGENDRQKQAADMMAKALEAEGIKLVHIIGPQTGHSYHPDAKKEINRRIDSIMKMGRDQVPSDIRFTTWTLRYNQMHWVRVDGLEEHWERARPR